MRLGLQLGVPKHTLENIRHQYTMYGEEMCKTEMLSTWLNSRAEEPTWAEVVSAVSRTGNKRVARRIANKYGEPCNVNCCTSSVLTEIGKILSYRSCTRCSFGSQYSYRGQTACMQEGTQLSSVTYCR